VRGVGLVRAYKPYDRPAGGGQSQFARDKEQQRENDKSRRELKSIPKDAFGKYPDDAGPELAGKNRPMWTAGYFERYNTPEKNAFKHWKKHGESMNLSPEEYVRKANDFAEHPEKRKNIKYDPSDPNSVFMCDLDTGELVIMNKDGTIRSYFNLSTSNIGQNHDDIAYKFDRAINNKEERRRAT
jgi:hypothetical protein